MIHPDRFQTMRDNPDNYDLNFDSIIDALSEGIRADPYSVISRKQSLTENFDPVDDADDFHVSNFECYYHLREKELFDDLQKARSKFTNLDEKATASGQNRIANSAASLVEVWRDFSGITTGTRDLSSFLVYLLWKGREPKFAQRKIPLVMQGGLYLNNSNRQSPDELLLRTPVRGRGTTATVAEGGDVQRKLEAAERMFDKKLVSESNMQQEKLLHEENNNKRKHDQESDVNSAKRVQLEVGTLTSVLQSDVFKDDVNSQKLLRDAILRTLGILPTVL